MDFESNASTSSAIRPILIISFLYFNSKSISKLNFEGSIEINLSFFSILILFTFSLIFHQVLTKNQTFILSIAAQITMTILRNIMKVELFGEVTILIGIITAFLIYDIKTDIEKKKVDKYSYK
mgnify:CR=1 FL=1